MALNFPDSPTLNQIYTDSVSGFSYQWNGTVWISFTPSDIGNIKVLDDISGSFNGSTQTFALTSSTISVSPPNPQSVIVNLGGVVQDPSDDYTVSGSNITFSTPPTSGLSFSGVVLGVAVPVGVSTGDAYYRQVYSPTGVQTSFSFVNGYTVGYLDVYHNGAKLVPTLDYTATDGVNFSLVTPAQAGDNVEAVGYRVSSVTIVNGALNSLTVSGIATIAGATNLGSNLNVTGITTLGTVGAGGTSLLVNGSARVTGILTVGTGSITLDGSTDRINVGTGLTLSSGGITAGVITATSFAGNLTGNVTGNATGLSGTPNLNVGVVTATSLIGSGANITGVVTATSFSGDGSGLSGVVIPLSVSSFSPASGATGASYTSNIVITYNTPVNLGVGTITLRTGSATGTIIESFNVQSTNRITVNQSVVTIDPTSNFDSLTNYYLVVPLGAIVSNNNVGLAITTYNFTSQQIDRTFFSWGDNFSGRLGQNNLTQYSSPVQIPGTTWSSISAGANHASAIKTDGTLWSWGYNGQGNLGQSNRTPYSSPIQIPGTTWSSVGIGNEHSLATKTDGTLWAWGHNIRGALGQNDTINRSSPVQIPGTTWSSVFSGFRHSLAIKTDGTLWSWGYNTNGELGLTSTISISSPTQIPGTTWSFSSSNGNSQFSLARKTDGTLWSWGQNNNGQLGQGDTSQYSSPRQIPGTTWSSISASGGPHALATKTDGTLWAWGRNEFGQLAQNNRTNYSSPVQIPGTTWNSIGGGGVHSLAIKTDGTLWSWGYNGRGQLGQNNTIFYSSPVQVPGTSWSSSSGGSQFSLAATITPI